MLKFKVSLLGLVFLMVGCSNTSSSEVEISSSSEYFNPYNYIKEVEFNDFKNKIAFKEDFIFILTSKSCSWCKRQEDEIFDFMHLNPIEMNYYYIDDIFKYLEMNNSNEPLYGEENYNNARDEYRYFASNVEKIGDYILGGEGEYIKSNYTERFGKVEPSLIYPSTFIYINGELKIENSKLGHGWSETEESFKTFVDEYKELIGN